MDMENFSVNNVLCESFLIIYQFSLNQGCVYLRKIVFETIIRSTNVFQKNKNKQFCISVDYQRILVNEN
jgi:hypothetical protein